MHILCKVVASILFHKQILTIATASSKAGIVIAMSVSTLLTEYHIMEVLARYYHRHGLNPK